MIEAAYSSLHAPKLAHLQVLRMSTLLAPLLGSSSTSSMLQGIPHSPSQVSSLPIAPRTPYPFRLLPIAGRFSESSASLPDEEEFDETPTSATKSKSIPRGTSLFQRLGSGLW